MQYMEVEHWKRESQIPPELLLSLKGLNHRFLELIASLPAGWDSGQGLCGPISAQIAALTSSQKEAVANCPYALFDLRFHDDDHWRSRLREPAGCVAEVVPVSPDALEFAQMAVFFAWHVASTSRFAAPLVLGMHPGTVGDFHSASIDRLPHLAAVEAVNLTARWSNCAAYWGALTAAAAEPHPARLKRIQLYGLQLAAAARLP
jgi:hypothetical protein